MHYKLSNRFYIIQIVLLIFLILLLIQAYRQNDTFSRSAVTEKYDDYKKQVLKYSPMKMVELKTIVQGIDYDLRYATIIISCRG